MKIQDVLRTDERIWSKFTKRNEYGVPRADKYNSRDNTVLNIDIPEVSQFLLENGLKIEYPDNKKFAICLTHDVDEIVPPWTHTIFASVHSLGPGRWKELQNNLFWRLRGNHSSPYCNFNEIMDIEEKYGAKSSFYFLATPIDIKRYRYDIASFEEEIREISDRGWEVGLHGGVYSFDNFENIHEEKQTLERCLKKKVAGYRNHYLRFLVPDSWVILENLGFLYDTTYGYNDRMGFRNGMCHPFYPYNANSDQFLTIVEIPLVIMDGTLHSWKGNFERKWERVKYFIDVTKKNHGVITVIWHSNSFNCSFKRDWARMYEKILQYGYENNAWLTNGEEITRFWQGFR